MSSSSELGSSDYSLSSSSSSESNSSDSEHASTERSLFSPPASRGKADSRSSSASSSSTDSSITEGKKSHSGGSESGAEVSGRDSGSASDGSEAGSAARGSDSGSDSDSKEPSSEASDAEARSDSQPSDAKRTSEVSSPSSGDDVSTKPAVIVVSGSSSSDSESAVAEAKESAEKETPVRVRKKVQSEVRSTEKRTPVRVRKNARSAVSPSGAGSSSAPRARRSQRSRDPHMSLLPSDRARLTGALFALASPPKKPAKPSGRTKSGRKSKSGRSGNGPTAESSKMLGRLGTLEGRVLPAALSQYSHKLDKSDESIFETDPVLRAVVQGDVETVRSLVSEESLETVESALQQSCTLLHIATVAGQPNIISHLIGICGAEVCKSDFMGRTPLHVAVMNDDPTCVESLLALDDDSDQWDVVKSANADGCTAMHLAVLSAAYTPQTNAQKKSRRKRGNSPPSSSSSSSSSSSESSSESDEPGKPENDSAARFEVLRALVKAIGRHTRKQPSFARELSRPNFSVGSLTPLHLAVRARDLKLVEWLCEINLVDEKHMALSDSVRKKRAKRSLIVPAEQVNKMSQTATFQFGLVNISAPDIAGDTPLHHAAAVGSELMVSLLVRMGAKVNAKNRSGFTPLHIASASLSDDACYVLVSNGADVSIRYEAAHHMREIVRDPVFVGTDAGKSGMDSDSSEMDEVDATIALLNKVNRFGFVEGEGDGSIGQEADPVVLKKRRKVELKRVQTWAPMFQPTPIPNCKCKVKWNMKKTRACPKCKILATVPEGQLDPSFLTKSGRQKLKSRVYKGIPDSLRSMYWLSILGPNLRIQREKKRPYDYFRKKSAKLPPQTSAQIDLDINRTHRDHLQFKERYGAGQVTLFNILTAYAARDQALDYCQGMNDMTGVLLMYMREEQAFWSLCTLVRDKKYALGGRMETGFPDLFKSYWVYDQLLKKHHPKLKAFLDGPPLDEEGNEIPKPKHKFLEQQIGPVLYAHRWFMMAFLGEMPQDTVLRIWDILFLEGYWILYLVAVHLMAECEKELLSMSFEEVMLFMKQADHPLKLKAALNSDEFIAGVKKLKSKISEKETVLLEEEYDRSHRSARTKKTDEMAARRKAFKESLDH